MLVDVTTTAALRPLPIALLAPLTSATMKKQDLDERTEQSDIIQLYEDPRFPVQRVILCRTPSTCLVVRSIVLDVLGHIAPAVL